MKISTLLWHIDGGQIALPVFQRGYVWNRDQVRGLFDSLYRRHPIGGLLVWETESEGGQPPRWWTTSRWSGQAAARRTTAHDIAVRCHTRPAASVLRRQR